MTKETLIKSAIKLLVNEQVKQGSWGYALEEDSAYEVSWKDVLKWLEQQPCEDCISREAVLDIWHTRYCNTREENEETQYKKIAFELPSVTPQQKVGHWNRKTKVDAHDIAGVKTWGIACQCDRCGFATIVIEDFGYYTYCPNCGAKMEAKE